MPVRRRGQVRRETLAAVAEAPSGIRGDNVDDAIAQLDDGRGDADVPVDDALATPTSRSERRATS